MAPATLFYQLVIALVLLVFGTFLFIILSLFFTLISLAIYMLLLRRKIKKSFGKMFKNMG